MDICGGNRHDDIVYDGRVCPLCELIDIRDNLEARIGDLECQVSGLESDLAASEVTWKELLQDVKLD